LPAREKDEKNRRESQEFSELVHGIESVGGIFIIAYQPFRVKTAAGHPFGDRTMLEFFFHHRDHRGHREGTTARILF
jgi:hypothetical protein